MSKSLASRPRPRVACKSCSSNQTLAKVKPGGVCFNFAFVNIIPGASTFQLEHGKYCDPNVWNLRITCVLTGSLRVQVCSNWEGGSFWQETPEALRLLGGLRVHLPGDGADSADCRWSGLVFFSLLFLSSLPRGAWFGGRITCSPGTISGEFPWDVQRGNAAHLPKSEST